MELCRDIFSNACAQEVLSTRMAVTKTVNVIDDTSDANKLPRNSVFTAQRLHLFPRIYGELLNRYAPMNSFFCEFHTLLFLQDNGLVYLILIEPLQTTGKAQPRPLNIYALACQLSSCS